MDRRSLLIAGASGFVGSVLSPSSVFAAGPKAKQNSKVSPKGIKESLAHCIVVGQACVQMCTEELAQGKKEMAECLGTARDMVATCQATLSLVSSKSKLAKKLAAVCADACRACADACDKHKEHFAHGMHLVCKDCRDACVQCEKDCREFVG
jgi:Cys-rich four helix bundle protein (predicted Tat secretion target)